MIELERKEPDMPEVERRHTEDCSGRSSPPGPSIKSLCFESVIFFPPDPNTAKMLFSYAKFAYN